MALAGRGIQLAPNIGMEDSHVETETEAEAVAAGQQLVERWKLQLSWLEPASRGRPAEFCHLSDYKHLIPRTRTSRARKGNT